MKRIFHSFLYLVVLAGLMSCQSSMPADRSPGTQTPTPTIVGTATRFTFHTVTPNPTSPAIQITSFEECAASSGSLLDGTYPRQCLTRDGKRFYEALDEWINYSTTYHTKADRPGLFITSTSDGGYLVGGTSTGCWILKLDASGEQEWVSDFYRELSEGFNLFLPSIWCRLARETPDGGYAAMGVAYDPNFGQYRKLFMVTLDHEGKLLSAQLLPKKGEKVPYLDRDGKPIWLTSLGLTQLGIPRGVYDTLDGGYLIVGSYEQSTPDSSMHMIKTDQNGKYVGDKNLCLDKKIQQTQEKGIVCSPDSAWDAIQLEDGSFVVVGGGWVLKTDSKGNIEWIQRISGYGFSLLPLPDSSILIAGEAEVEQKKSDGVLIKVDSAGNIQWQKTFGGDQQDGFTALEQRPDGEITVMGWTKSAGLGSHLWLLGINSAVPK